MCDEEKHDSFKPVSAEIPAFAPLREKEISDPDPVCASETELLSTLNVKAILRKRFSKLLHEVKDGSIDKFIAETAADVTEATLSGRPDLVAKVINQTRVRAERYRLAAAASTFRAIADLLSDMSMFAISIVATKG